MAKYQWTRAVPGPQWDKFLLAALKCSTFGLSISRIISCNTPAGTITPDQASAHIGETVTVCGKVYSTKTLDSGRLLNGWFKKKLIFSLDRRGRFLSIRIERVDMLNQISLKEPSGGFACWI